MMSKAALISDLAIERDPEVTEARTPLYRRPSLFVVVAALLAVGAWFALRSPAIPSVDVALVRAPATSAAGTALLEASGYVVARREATVSSKVTGRVTALLIEEGQEVAAGQVIARLDASNVAAALDQADAQVMAAEASAETALITEVNTRSRLARVEKLHRSGWLSSQAHEDARAAYESARSGSEQARRQIAVARASRAVTGRDLDDTIVRAPFAGVVTVKAAQVGEIVSPISAGGGFTRTGIGTIVDMSSLEVEVDVAEGYINRVSPGMPATVRLNAYPDWAIPAEVAAVIPTGDRSKATIKVRIRFKLQDRRIIPEMGAKVSFLNSAPDRREAPKGVTEIPSQAVIAQPNGTSAVFVVSENLTLERRVIRAGGKNGDQQFVTGGLAAGERIVAGKLTGLRHDMRVRVNED